MGTITSAFSVEHLNKTYANGVEALRDVSLSIVPGDFFALLGPNGAGKTTLIGILTGLVNKTSGHAHVFGHDIDTQASAAKACISLVPQEFNFHIFKPVEQILLDNAGYYGMPRRIAKVRAEHWLKTLNLWGKRKKQAVTLSGGMKRRLMLARAMMHEPKLLILDEPTAGVDIEIRHSMWEFLEKINKDDITIVLTTHYLEEAESLCKNIAIIDEGKIIEHSNMPQLLQKVHVESFVLNLAAPLKRDLRLTSFTHRVIDKQTIEVDLKRAQSLNELFAELSKHNVQVSAMKNKRNRLQQLFIQLTQKENKTVLG